MASVEFCKIPPLPWPAMASMVSWTPIEGIGWTLFLEVHGNGVRILHGSGSGIHGIP